MFVTAVSTAVSRSAGAIDQQTALTSTSIRRRRRCLCCNARTPVERPRPDVFYARVHSHRMRCVALPHVDAFAHRVRCLMHCIALRCTAAPYGANEPLVGSFRSITVMQRLRSSTCSTSQEVRKAIAALRITSKPNVYKAKALNGWVRFLSCVRLVQLCTARY